MASAGDGISRLVQAFDDFRIGFDGALRGSVARHRRLLNGAGASVGVMQVDYPIVIRRLRLSGSPLTNPASPTGNPLVLDATKVGLGFLEQRGTDRVARELVRY